MCARSRCPTPSGPDLEPRHPPAPVNPVFFTLRGLSHCIDAALMKRCGYLGEPLISPGFAFHHAPARFTFVVIADGPAEDIVTLACARPAGSRSSSPGWSDAPNVHAGVGRARSDSCWRMPARASVSPLPFPARSLNCASVARRRLYAGHRPLPRRPSADADGCAGDYEHCTRLNCIIRRPCASGDSACARCTAPCFARRTNTLASRGLLHAASSSFSVDPLG